MINGYNSGLDNVEKELKNSTKEYNKCLLLNGNYYEKLTWNMSSNVVKYCDRIPIISADKYFANQVQKQLLLNGSYVHTLKYLNKINLVGGVTLNMKLKFTEATKAPLIQVKENIQKLVKPISDTLKIIPSMIGIKNNQMYMLENKDLNDDRVFVVRRPLQPVIKYNMKGGLVAHSALLVRKNGQHHLIEYMDDGKVYVSAIPENQITDKTIQHNATWNKKEVGRPLSKNHSIEEIAKVMQGIMDANGQYSAINNNCHNAQEATRLYFGLIEFPKVSYSTSY